MLRGSVHVSITAGFCISLAASICILPASWVGSWLLAIAVHEFSHCITILLCGCKLQTVRLTSFGAEITAHMNRCWQEIFCSLAGPVGGLTILLLHNLLPIAALCTLVLSAYNLLPLRNLDGGRALYALLRTIFTQDQANNFCILTDKTVRVFIFILALFLSFRLQWFIPLAFSAVLLFPKKRRIKSTCKRKTLRVQ